MDLTPSPLFQLQTMAKMEVKSSLLDNMIGVGDMVLLEPLNEETFIGNLKKRFDHNEIYVSACSPPPPVAFRSRVLWQSWLFHLTPSFLLFLSSRVFLLHPQRVRSVRQLG